MWSTYIQPPAGSCDLFRLRKEQNAGPIFDTDGRTKDLSYLVPENSSKEREKLNREEENIYDSNVNMYIQGEEGEKNNETHSKRREKKG